MHKEVCGQVEILGGLELVVAQVDVLDIRERAYRRWIGTGERRVLAS